MRLGPMRRMILTAILFFIMLFLVINAYANLARVISAYEQLDELNISGQAVGEISIAAYGVSDAIVEYLKSLGVNVTLFQPGVEDIGLLVVGPQALEDCDTIARMAASGTQVLFIGDNPIDLMNSCLGRIPLTLEILAAKTGNTKAIGVTLTQAGQWYVPWYRLYSSLADAIQGELSVRLQQAWSNAPKPKPPMLLPVEDTMIPLVETSLTWYHLGRVANTLEIECVDDTPIGPIYFHVGWASYIAEFAWAHYDDLLRPHIEYAYRVAVQHNVEAYRYTYLFVWPTVLPMYTGSGWLGTPERILLQPLNSEASIFASIPMLRADGPWSILLRALEKVGTILKERRIQLETDNDIVVDTVRYHENRPDLGGLRIYMQEMLWGQAMPLLAPLLDSGGAGVAFYVWGHSPIDFYFSVRSSLVLTEALGSRSCAVEDQYWLRAWPGVGLLRLNG